MNEIEAKMVAIIENYVNGNRRHAAGMINCLSKSELAMLLIHLDHYAMCSETGLLSKLEFNGFVLRVLDGEF